MYVANWYSSKLDDDMEGHIPQAKLMKKGKIYNVVFGSPKDDPSLVAIHPLLTFLKDIP